MDFLTLAKERYSCRGFEEKSVEEEKIQKLLEVARIAPTAVNYQPQRILVITDKETIGSLETSNCTRYTFKAPLLMVICYDKTVSWKRRYDGMEMGMVDASIITTHIMLEATELGLGSTWVGSFDPKIAIDILKIPENYEPVALLPIGYPSMQPSNRHSQRNSINDFVFREKFNS